MRQELTRDQIRTNLMTEYAKKPRKMGMLIVSAGLIVGVLCFGTGRIPAAVVGIACIAVGISELRKSHKIRSILERDAFTVKEGRCSGKRITSGQGGTKRIFCMENNISYIAASQDVRLWEKTTAGEGFYLIYFENSDEVRKIYPKQKFAYMEEMISEEL